jgi:beta-glucosidase
MRIDHKAYHRRLRRIRAVAILAGLLVCLASSISLASQAPDADIPPVTEQRSQVDIDAIINGMTLDQKLTVLHADQPSQVVTYTVGGATTTITIPKLTATDGPSGIRADDPATALPSPVALASTFDPDLAFDYGQVIGREGRAYDRDVLYGPMVNLVRVPQAGRNFETLGEDPFLASQMVAEETRGVEDEDLIPTVKHYAENNQESQRQSINVNVDEQTLHEMELMGFEAAVNAGAGGVMCAYNKVNGTYSCENPVLLNDILRGRWGFTGFVVTDFGAAHSTGAIMQGLDVEMGMTSYFRDPLKQAVLSGTIPITAVDTAVRRVLTSMDDVGLLDGSIPPRPVITDTKEADAAVAKEVALAGAVLLRNMTDTLPLQDDDLQSLVVVGPTAATPLIGGGGSARVIPFHRKSPLHALTESVTYPITYVVGIDLDGVVVPSSTLSFTQSYSDETEIDFTGANALPSTTGTYMWTGILTATTEGDYGLNVHNSGGQGEFWLNGDRILSIGGFFGGGSLIPTRDGLTNNGATVHLTAGAHAFTLTIGASGWGPPPYPPSGPIELRLAWVTPAWRQAKLDEAVAVASSANAVIMFGYVEGTEFEDRASLALPGGQDELIAAVTSANPNNIVVLNVGAPVLMPWVEDTGAILNMWYAGQEGADATAELLLGEANPGGKLPVTFPRSEADLPTAGSPEMYPGIEVMSGTMSLGWQQWYSETIYVGYRWYDAQGIEPLFPFGHGLSYTDFECGEDLSVERNGDGYDITFTISNTGSVTGTEVPQVYLGPVSELVPPAGTLQMPLKKLVGFDRIKLAPGSSQEVTVHIGARELSYWSTSAHDWVVAEGVRPLYVGSSSRDICLQGAVGMAEIYLPLVMRNS